MPVTVLRRAWQTKPPLGAQINWGHPLAQGLAHCWLFNEGAGTGLRNLVNPAWSATINRPTEITWGLASYGLGLYSTDSVSATGVSIPANLPNVPAQSFSVDCALVPLLPSDPGEYGAVIARSNAEGLFLRPTMGLLEYYHPSLAFRNLTPVSTGVPRRYGLSRGSEAVFYLNGIEDGRYTAAATWDPTFTSMLNDVIAETYTGFCGYIRLWNRVLTPTEIAWLATEPYAFIAPPSLARVYSFTAGPTFNPAWARPNVYLGGAA